MTLKRNHSAASLTVIALNKVRRCSRHSIVTKDFPLKSLLSVETGPRLYEVADTDVAAGLSPHNLSMADSQQPGNGANLPAVRALCEWEHGTAFRGWKSPIWTRARKHTHTHTLRRRRRKRRMYSYMCYFPRLEHIAHYKAKNQTTVKTNFPQRAHKRTHGNAKLAGMTCKLRERERERGGGGEGKRERSPTESCR